MILLGFLSINNTLQQWGAPYHHKKGTYDKTKHKVISPWPTSCKARENKSWKGLKMHIPYSALFNLLLEKHETAYWKQKRHFLSEFISYGKKSKRNFSKYCYVWNKCYWHIFEINSRCMRTCFFYTILIFMNKEAKTWKFILFLHRMNDHL